MKDNIRKVLVMGVLYGAAFGTGIGNEGIKNITTAILYIAVITGFLIIWEGKVRLGTKGILGYALLPFVLFYYGKMFLGFLWVVVLIGLVPMPRQEKAESYFDKISKQK